MRAFLFLLVAGFAHSTRIRFLNHCGHQVHVMKTMAGHGSEEQAMLDPGEEEMTEEMTEGEMNFKDGDDGENMAEFNINGWNGMDSYDLNFKHGYTTPMMIQTHGQQQVGGFTVDCRDRRCLSAYLYPNDSLKRHFIGTGGTFTLTFCP